MNLQTQLRAILSSVFLGSCLLTVAACSVKDESKSYTYDYTVNGCPTGKQTFSDKGAYCAALKNEALNRGCARDAREKTYDTECKASTSSFTSASQETDTLGVLSGREGTSSKTLKMPVDQFGSMPALERNADGTPTQSKTNTPLYAHVRALPTARLSATSVTVGDEIVTELKGTATIRTIEPAFDRASLDLSSATRLTITSEKLDDCKLTAVELKSNGDQVDVLLKGTDTQDNIGKTSCLVKLSTMAMMGFSVELLNVRLAAPETGVIPTVLLEISTNPALNRRR